MSEDIKKRYETALKNRQEWDDLINDVIKLTRPTSNVTTLTTTTTNKGTIEGEVFDATAIDALNTRVSSIIASIFPQFQDWISLELPKDANDTQSAGLVAAATKIQAAIDNSNFYTEIDQVLGEASISVGSLLIRKGTDAQPLIFESIPLKRIIPEESTDGMIRSAFYGFEISIATARIRYQQMDGYKEPQGWGQIAEPESEQVKIVEGFIYDYETNQTNWQVYLESDWQLICEYEGYTNSPLICARERKAGGEIMGRGRIMDAYPDIVTLNKVKEMGLDNAAWNLGGLFQADDDGVINVDAISLEPRSIIPKAMGSKGLQPIPISANFNLTQFVVQDLQTSIRQMILGPELPPAGEGDRRTAYEYQVRLQERQVNEVPQNARLISELYRPMIMRIIDILADASLANSDYYIAEDISGQEIMPTPSSPVAIMSKQAQLSREITTIMGMANAFGIEVVNSIIKPDAIVRRHLIAAGFNEDEIKTADEIAAEQQAIAEQQQQMGGMPPVTPTGLSALLPGAEQ